MSQLTRLWTHITSALSRLRANLPPLDVLFAKERRDLRTNLRALEIFCRRLAITEALQLPPTTPSITAKRAHTTKRKRRQPSLRLWPRPRPMPVRITMLGRPTLVREIWREQRRAALVARLAAARLNRQPLHLRLADRIDALQRFIDSPRAALRRLARKLQRNRKIAFAIATRRAPISELLCPEESALNDRLCWQAIRDTS